MKNFSEEVRGYLFQGRFGSCVLDECHLLAAVRYVENTPVAASIVKHAWEYPWSSAAYHVGNMGNDILVKDRNLHGFVHDWRGYLVENAGDEPAAIRKATKTGRPAGNNDFITALEDQTGRVMRRATPGRKKNDDISVMSPIKAREGRRKPIKTIPTAGTRFSSQVHARGSSRLVTKTHVPMCY